MNNQEPRGITVMPRRRTACFLSVTEHRSTGGEGKGGADNPPPNGAAPWGISSSGSPLQCEGTSEPRARRPKSHREPGGSWNLKVLLSPHCLLPCAPFLLLHCGPAAKQRPPPCSCGVRPRLHVHLGLVVAATDQQVTHLQ